MKVLLAFAFLSVCVPAHAASPSEFDEMTGGSLSPPPAQTGTATADPTQGRREQAKGFYSKGSLANADTFPWEGRGFVKIFRPRQRQFATFDMIQVLRKAVAAVQKEHPSHDRIQIGDIAAQRGGSLVPMHASHQNGLDADIAYIRADGTEQNPDNTDGFEEVFVENDRLTRNFDLPRNWTLIKALQASGRVHRMFVNEVVKRAFCDYARQIGEFEANRETLRRLRPYEGHMDHVHVRLTCPKNSPHCVPQEEIPDGPGCS